MERIAAFDIGGSAIKYGVWTNNQLTETNQFKTPATFEEMLAQMQQVLADFGGEFTGVAISAPGAVNTVKREIEGISAVPYLHHFPIFDELEKQLNLPVAIENDANCAGISEVELGAGKNGENIVFLVLGTGVGGAVFINRTLYKGSHLFGGEFGLMKNAGSEIFSMHGTGVKAANKYSKQTDIKVNGKELFDKADNHDLLAQEILDQMYQHVAEGLYNIQVSIDPDLIVIGGGISARKNLVTPIQEKLQTLLDAQGVGNIMPVIRLCEFQNNANLIGAVLNFKKMNFSQ